MDHQNMMAKAETAFLWQKAQETWLQKGDQKRTSFIAILTQKKQNMAIKATKKEQGTLAFYHKKISAI